MVRWCLPYPIYLPYHPIYHTTQPTTPEVYPLLIGDLSVLLSFRSLEDTLTTPLPTLDIAASPDIIARGLMLYADPLHAAAHIYSVIADGMGLGLFWMAAVLWGGAEAVDMGTARSYTLSTLNVFKCWLALCNVRLVVLFLQVRWLAGCWFWRTRGRSPPIDDTVD